jgi:hypothetical protein
MLHYSKATAALLKKIYSFRFKANLVTVKVVLEVKVSMILSKYSLSFESLINYDKILNSTNPSSSSAFSKTPSLGSFLSAASKG